MTVITALRSGGRVWMASDSMCEDSTQRWDYPRKIFTVHVDRGPDRTLGEVLVGCAGVAALAELVRYNLHWPPLPDGDDDERMNAWAHSVARDFYETCRARPHMVDNEGDPKGVMLLAQGSRLWEITADLALPIDSYASIGSGALAAQGAIYAMDRYVDEPSPEFTVYVAAEAAVKHAAGCGGDIVVLST